MKLKKNLTRRVFGAFIFAASLAGVCAPSLAQQANPVQESPVRETTMPNFSRPYCLRSIKS